MSTVFNEPINLGDLLKYEEDTQAYSRDLVAVAPNQVMMLGTVVGMVNNQIKGFDPAATDGSEIPVGILLHAIDTTQPGKHQALILAREAIVSDAYVVWPAGISSTAKEAAIAHLKSLSILIRQGV